jgi:hypothetical protein
MDNSRPTWESVKITPYCPHGPGDRGRLTNGRWADPWGGGPKSAWLGSTLYGHHCAVDPKRIPYGTILWVAKPYNRLLVAVDCGGAVDGLHIDVCLPTVAEFWPMRNATLRARVWRMGRLSRSEARRWRP